jgi:PAS domain S-box-containing protein
MKTDLEVKEGILREQVRLAIKQLPVMQATSFVVALVLSAAVRNIVPHGNILAWLSMVLVIVLSRIALYTRFVKVSEKPFAGKYWENIYLLLALLSGLIWGLSAFIIFPAGNPWLISLFVLVIASLSAATTISHSSIRLGPAAWSGPAMLAYAIRCLMEGGESGYTISFLIVLYLFTILRYSFTHNTSITSSISLKFENVELLEDLQEVNDILRRDIAERRQTEVALLNSEKRYRLLFRNSPVGIFNYDTQLRITDCNNRFVSILRASRDRLIGLDMTTLKDRSVVPCLYRAAEGEEGMYEGFYRATSGPAEIWISMRTSPIFDKDGKVTSCVGIAEDITARKEAEMRLQESEQKYRQIFENVQDIFYQVDLNGNIIEISPSIERYSGYAREELIGMPVLSVYYYPEDRAKLLDALTGKGEIVDYEVRLKTKDGRLVYTSVNAHLLFDAQGNPAGIEGSLRDITERKRLEEQLTHAQKIEAIGQFVGGIAHDFNNILNAIIGYGCLLEMKMTEDDPLKANVDYILESADRAAQLVRGLLAFSRKQTLNPMPINLNETIKGVAKLLKPIIREDIDLSVTLKEEDLHVVADTGQIEQVLMNLAANARDAMPKGGSLTICSEIAELDDEYVTARGYGSPGTYALVSVTDTGIGMDEETRTRIFEPFFTTKEVGKGTGLGLAMVYGIIKQHKGYVDVSSEPEKGTTFKLFIPAIESAPAVQERPDVSEYPLEGTETILLAEDNVMLRELSKKVLGEHGYTVIAAENGEDAVTKFIKHKESVQLLLLDMVMPKKNGIEVYEEIKGENPGIKVLFVSGHADIPHTEEILGSGVDFMSKPYSPKALLGKVRDVLDK